MLRLALVAMVLSSSGIAEARPKVAARKSTSTTKRVAPRDQPRKQTTKFVATKPTKPAKQTTPADPMGACTKELDARKIAYKPASRLGIANAIEIAGPLGGVTWSPAGWASGQALVIDCSLAVSLDEAGRYLRELGIDKATFSSAYSRRTVRGSNRPSKHSFGLAIDVSAYAGPELGTLRIDRDYEQGLGDGLDCMGQPLTKGGAVLKVLQCQLARSGLFHLVLSPDYDDAHHDHFHLEVKPWSQRTELRSQALAIH